MDYTRRVIDSELDELMPGLPAVALEGAKGVGKTATALRRSKSRILLAEGRERDVLAADPEQVMRHVPPVLIDEWQLVPEVWDRVRRAVDRSDRCPHPYRGTRWKGETSFKFSMLMMTGHQVVRTSTAPLFD